MFGGDVCVDCGGLPHQLISSLDAWFGGATSSTKHLSSVMQHPLNSYVWLGKPTNCTPLKWG